MAIIDLFSRRQKLLRGEAPDVYFYDNFPKELKIQVVHIIRDSFGRESGYGLDYKEEMYKAIRDILIREYGVFRLGNNDSFEGELLDFFLNENDVERSLDVIELSFRMIDTYIRNNNEYKHNTKPKIKPDEAISELNERFKQHGFGFQYEAGEIIRVDSTYVHSEIVKPVIKLIWNKKFSGANEEYLKAHEHYRHGRNKECLAECLKAFESTMKIICKEKGWSYDNNDTSKKLINICMQNQLVPNFTQNQFSSLKSLLESGIPTIRNRLGGHGQGDVQKTVDDEMTRYALNLTGTNIIFLIEQSKI